MFGLGVAGMAVANALHERGETVILADDEATKQHEDFARALNCEFIDATDETAVVGTLKRITRLAPAHDGGNAACGRSQEFGGG